MVVALISSTWVVALVTPIVMTIVFTYWCRSGSVDCFQNLFRVSTTCLPGVYEVMLYGPSDIMWSRSWQAVGHVSVVLHGRAELNGMARMSRKSLAGWVRLNRSVEEFGVVMPEMAWVFWKFAMFAAVGLFDFLAKNAVSALK